MCDRWHYFARFIPHPECPAADIPPGVLLIPARKTPENPHIISISWESYFPSAG